MTPMQITFLARELFVFSEIVKGNMDRYPEDDNVWKEPEVSIAVHMYWEPIARHAIALAGPVISKSAAEMTSMVNNHLVMSCVAYAVHHRTVLAQPRGSRVHLSPDSVAEIVAGYLPSIGTYVNQSKMRSLGLVGRSLESIRKLENVEDYEMDRDELRDIQQSLLEYQSWLMTSAVTDKAAS